MRRRVKLFFDENDEMVDFDTDSNIEDFMCLECPDDKKKAVVNPIFKDLTLDEITQIIERNLFYSPSNQKISKINVNLGDEAFDKGITEITPNIFESKDKFTNAGMFIENYLKAKKRRVTKLDSSNSAPVVKMYLTDEEGGTDPTIEDLYNLGHDDAVKAKDLNRK